MTSPIIHFALALIFTFGIVINASLGAAAQSLDGVLKRAAKAMGGESALRHITSREAKGTITRLSDGAQGDFQMITMRPDLYSLAFEVGGFEFGEGFNGKSAWRRDSHSGLRTLTGDESAAFRAAVNYRNNLWLNYRREKAKLSYAGQEMIGGRTAHAIVMTIRPNAAIKMWFDMASGLLVKEELPLGMGAFEYSDRRAVDGVMEPFKIRLSIGSNWDGEQFSITLSEVKHRETLDRALFNIPKISSEPLPDVTTLIKEVSVRQEEVERVQEEYTCTAVMAFREQDKNGGLRDKESKTFDVTFYHGRKIQRLIAKNGQPLSPRDQTDEDRRVEKLIREIDKREAEGDRSNGIRKMGPPDPAARPASISEVLRASRLVNPRRERLHNRGMIVFDFEPLPGYKPATTADTFMSRSSGVIWVDTASKQVARVEMRLVDSVSIGGGLIGAVKSGATFISEQGLIKSDTGDELWMPTYDEMTIPVRAVFVGFTINSLMRYGDYRRFDVKVEKERLKNSMKPE